MSTGSTYFSIEVAKLVTQPFCDFWSASCIALVVRDREGTWFRRRGLITAVTRESSMTRKHSGSGSGSDGSGGTYVALESALEDQLFSHGDG